MCGFPLAEERKKRKTFFSHMAGSLGTGVRGFFRSRDLCKVSVFVLPSAIALHASPPTREELVDCVKFEVKLFSNNFFVSL